MITLCYDARCIGARRCHRAERERYGNAPGESYGPRCEPAILDPAKVAALRERLKERAQRRVRPSPEPRYDDVFYDGVAWLDTLAHATDEQKDKP